ncbi:YdcH family protein [Salipiger sp.]|uniref:YdcH family protein n=1 Tax=Salipiger sp. TaxID=2078585 RepID=UPI003A96E80A
MSLSSHLQELKKKHQHLSTAVEEMQRSPGVDDLHVAELKKQKLRIKEEITRLGARPH